MLHYIDFEITSKNLKDSGKLSKYFNDCELSNEHLSQVDKKVQQAKEILSKDIELTPEFSKEIQFQVDKMAKTLKHPKKVRCQLSKMVIYEKGGFSGGKHQSNVIFTLVVEIFVNHETQGGTLKLNNQSKIPSPIHKKELSLVLYYRDVSCQITTLTKGKRIFMIFDVEELETLLLHKEIETYEKKFCKGLTKLKKSDVKKIGFFLEHSHYGEKKEEIVLKGKDAILFEILKHYCDNIDIIEVCVDKYNRVFRKEISNIMKTCDIFEKFYFQVDRGIYYKRKQKSIL